MLLTVMVSPEMLVKTPVVVKVVAGAVTEVGAGFVAEVVAGAVAEVATDRKDAVSSSCWG